MKKKGITATFKKKLNVYYKYHHFVFGEYVDRFCNAFGVFMYLYNNLLMTKMSGQKSPRNAYNFF